MTKIAVFGAGTWGIALARLLAANGRDVTVWSAIPAELKSLSTTPVTYTHLRRQGAGARAGEGCALHRLLPAAAGTGRPLRGGARL